jgi:hypothetical protein
MNRRLPTVSAREAIRANRAGNFSVGRLTEFLTAPGQDVRITVKPARKRRGEMEVVADEKWHRVSLI